MFLTALISLAVCGLPIAESECPSILSQDQRYYCVDQTCIASFKRCDGTWDCSNGADEYGCGICTSNEIKCHDATDRFCVPHSQVCDGHSDCLDGTDEQGVECSAAAGTASLGTTYLFFVIPAVVLLACLIFVGLCAVVVVLYNKEKYGHRQRVTAVDVNTIDIVAVSSMIQHAEHSTLSSCTCPCAGGKSGKSGPYPAVDPPPPYNQTVSSRSPPPPYSSRVN